ncbi:MAG: hypothetical protein ACO3NZ_07295 [Pirellulales bacterium]
MAATPEPVESPATSPVASETPKPKGRFWLVVGLVVGAVAVAGFAAPWILSSPEMVAKIVQSSLKGAEADVSVASVRIGWLGPTVVEGITFEPRDGSERPVSIGRVEGDRGLLGMLLSMGDLGTFRVSGLEVDVVFNEDRTSNLQSLAAKVDDASGGEPKRESRRSPVTTEIVVDQAVVRIAGPWATKRWVSDPIDLDLVLEPDPGNDRSRWRVGQVQLLDEAVLEPAVAEGILAYIAPILADATIVGGRFSLGIQSASLPVGDPGAGTVEGRLVMHEVDIGPGELVKHVMSVVPVDKPNISTLRISDSSDIQFALANRRVSHEGLKFGVPLPDSNERLDVESAGSVGLDDKSLDLRLTLPLPKTMPEDRPLLQSLAGKKLGLSIGGTLEQPEVDMDGTLRSSVAGLIGRRADGDAEGQTTAVGAGAGTAATRETTLGAVGSVVAEQIRGQLPPESVDPATAAAVVDLVGGILDEVGKRRAARKASEQADPNSGSADGRGEPTPPKDGADSAGRTRGSLLKRLLDRVDEATAPTSADEPQSEK